MSRQYQVQALFGSKWVTLRTHNLQVDALDDVRINCGESYQLRIVRIVKTVVFEEKDVKGSIKSPAQIQKS